MERKEKNIELQYGEKLKLDKKDKRIIRELQKNCRQGINEISKNTSLKRHVVKYRIERMEKQGLIRQYHAFINPALLGYPFYAYVGFSLLKREPQREKKFIESLKANERVVYLAKNSGEWDFSIAICAKNYEDFDNVLGEIREKFTNIIKDFDVLPVIQEYKYDWMADLVAGE